MKTFRLVKALRTVFATNVYVKHFFNTPRAWRITWMVPATTKIIVKKCQAFFQRVCKIGTWTAYPKRWCGLEGIPHSWRWWGSRWGGMLIAMTGSVKWEAEKWNKKFVSPAIEIRCQAQLNCSCPHMSPILLHKIFGSSKNHRFWQLILKGI